MNYMMMILNIVQILVMLNNDVHAIRSINHKLHTYHCNKISINSYDNKMYILNDGITSLAHGHYTIKTTILLLLIYCLYYHFIYDTKYASGR